jgi:hypothetical protein
VYEAHYLALERHASSFMKATLHNKLLDSLQKASQHNSQIMVRPEVILWPDPERQWEGVIHIMQETLPALLVLGDYHPLKRQGPSIWLKCMVANMLPESDWPTDTTPIIYLPGIAKNDFKNIADAALDLQPLMEYQCTGNIFTQVNGREWTVLAFMENQQAGLGLKVAQDPATKETLGKALPVIFQDEDIQYPSLVDANFLHGLLFPNAESGILNWLSHGDKFLQSLSTSEVEGFLDICRSQYKFEPYVKNMRAIAEMLGAQRNNSWIKVWQHYTNAPHKYPEIADLLRMAKPDDLGSGMFACPEQSWPQTNEEKEEVLRTGLEAVSELHPKEALKKLEALEQQHGMRRAWVWAELGQAPLAKALPHLLQMAEICTGSFPIAEIKELQKYYEHTGFKADQAMRRSLAAVKKEKDKSAIIKVIRTIYQPWLEYMTQKFQDLVAKDSIIFTNPAPITESDEFILFVDAMRFELGMEFFERMGNAGYKTSITAGWSAIPSLTPTAKPAISPLSSLVSPKSNCNEFRPQLLNGKDLLTATFRSALADVDCMFVSSAADIQVGKRHWQEIGDIDTKGHTEQAGIVRRIEELFEQIQETISTAFEKGIKRIKIVTDHGWLLLPGGLPKQELNRDLAETRWGRCALIKEGASTTLLHLPWRWNPGIYIAYAPGISFFKKNEEYAHGGISIQECLVPMLTVDSNLAAVSNRAKLKDFKWINLTCKIETDHTPDGYFVDIRTKYDAADTSIVLSERKSIRDNKITLMVDDDAIDKSATVVLLNEQGVILDKKPTLVGG